MNNTFWLSPFLIVALLDGEVASAVGASISGLVGSAIVGATALIFEQIPTPTHHGLGMRCGLGSM